MTFDSGIGADSVDSISSEGRGGTSLLEPLLPIVTIPFSETYSRSAVSLNAVIIDDSSYSHTCVCDAVPIAASDG